MTTVLERQVKQLIDITRDYEVKNTDLVSNTIRGVPLPAHAKVLERRLYGLGLFARHSPSLSAISH